MQTQSLQLSKRHAKVLSEFIHQLSTVLAMAVLHMALVRSTLGRWWCCGGASLEAQGVEPCGCNLVDFHLLQCVLTFFCHLLMILLWSTYIKVFFLHLEGVAPTAVCNLVLSMLLSSRMLFVFLFVLVGCAVVHVMWFRQSDCNPYD